MDYKQAGVDVEAGDALVDWLRSQQKSKGPHQDKLISGIGGFAALFRADFKSMEEPCLVSCTDGVGTKVKLASHFGRFGEVAQDLVAMCVNDMICSGAQPLFFLDYYACGQLDLNSAKDFLSGVQKACHESDCALIGGETAEMPGVYQKGDFDCAGFSVGVVDRKKVLGRDRVEVGDQLIAVASSGFHSNGFSLLRKVFEKDLNDWEEQLMRPTALYVQLVHQLLKNHTLHAIAHVTGGGMDNLPRVLPKGTLAKLKAWKIPPEFLEVQKRAKLSMESLLQTLNCGIGLVLVLPKNQVDSALQLIQREGHKAWRLGEVEALSGAEDESQWSVDLDQLTRENS